MIPNIKNPDSVVPQGPPVLLTESPSGSPLLNPEASPEARQIARHNRLYKGLGTVMIGSGLVAIGASVANLVQESPYTNNSVKEQVVDAWPTLGGGAIGIGNGLYALSQVKRRR